MVLRLPGLASLIPVLQPVADVVAGLGPTLDPEPGAALEAFHA